MNFLKYTLDRYTYKLSAQTRLFVKGAIFRTAPPLGKNPDKNKKFRDFCSVGMMVSQVDAAIFQ